MEKEEEGKEKETEGVKEEKVEEGGKD